MRRSQRLKTASSNAIFKPASRIPYLPPEIVNLFARYLGKTDLKSLRLVSGTWHRVVTPQLFDRIYVSPRTKDLDVFKEITSHPVLAASVKELLYDVSTFCHVSQTDYFAMMCKEIADQPMDHHLGYRERTIYRRMPPRFRQLINKIERGELVSHLRQEHVEDSTVIVGYDEWLRLWHEEIHCFFSGTFFRVLCAGLSNLSNLHSVRMDDDVWGRAIHRHRYPRGIRSPLLSPIEGSPLARQWKPFHPVPQQPERGELITRSTHLQTIVLALFESQRKIMKFYFETRMVEEGLPPTIFMDHQPYRLSPIQGKDALKSALKSVLSQLETLELTIRPWDLHGTIRPSTHAALGCLPDVLLCMPGLKRLRLDLTTGDSVCFTYGDVFPSAGGWPYLTQLHLTGLAITGLDLYYLLDVQIGPLERLWLCHIDLLEGTWEGAIELLKWKAPSYLLDLQGIYHHAGGQWWPCRPANEQEGTATLGEYHDYIMGGGRHPSLPVDCDSSSSKWYAYDLLQSASVEHRRKVFHLIKEKYRYLLRPDITVPIPWLKQLLV
ncbi:MAG: hypothetical protein Q9188_003415 [Gyalolechia gomerana]